MVNNEKNTYEHCCKFLADDIKRPETYINYKPMFRKYYVELQGSSSIQCIWFCPWCGKELPRDLRQDWFNILENEYGLEDPRGDQEHLVPEKFKSDEWWKKQNIKEIIVPKNKIVNYMKICNFLQGKFPNFP